MTDEDMDRRFRGVERRLHRIEVRKVTTAAVCRRLLIPICARTIAFAVLLGRLEFTGNRAFW